MSSPSVHRRRQTQTQRQGLRPRLFTHQYQSRYLHTIRTEHTINTPLLDHRHYIRAIPIL